MKYTLFIYRPEEDRTNANARGFYAAQGNL